jgi:hypothetical protein
MSSALAVIEDVGASNGICRATKPLRGFEAGRLDEEGGVGAAVPAGGSSCDAPALQAAAPTPIAAK